MLSQSLGPQEFCGFTLVNMMNLTTSWKVDSSSLTIYKRNNVTENSEPWIFDWQYNPNFYTRYTPGSEESLEPNTTASILVINRAFNTNGEMQVNYRLFEAVGSYFSLIFAGAVITGLGMMM